MSFKVTPFSGEELQELVNSYFELYEQFLKDPSFDGFDTAITGFLKANPTRSSSSIVAGFCQISTVMVNHGLPYITVLEPLMNYSTTMEQTVFKKILEKDNFYEQVLSFCSFSNFPEKLDLNMGKLLEQAPDLGKSKANTALNRHIKFGNLNFLQLEQNMQAVKKHAMKVVMKYEKFRLGLAGKDYLLEHIKHLNSAKDSGFGCTLQSKNEDGTNRYILIAGSKLGKLSPYCFTENELALSQEKPEQFYTYRVFNLFTKPRLFIQKGPLDKVNKAHPIQFQANFH